MRVNAASARQRLAALLLVSGILVGAPHVLAQPAVLSPGREFWQDPWVPDLRSPPARGGSSKVPISPERRIDVVILPDGYLDHDAADFVRAVDAWYRRFLTFPAWAEFRGAFRVRGLWTSSAARATADETSHFAVKVVDRKVAATGSKATAAAVFRALSRLDVNRSVRGKRYSHLVVVMLIKDERGRNPSGVARGVASPDHGTVVPVAFGADSHHEFGHAFGGLRDEYIGTAGSRAKGKPPERRSLFSVSNLSYTKESKSLPWSHLVPGSALNPDRASVIGVLWPGGGAEHGVWHSEPRCFMNGRHDNWDLAKTRRGAALREPRFCFWCEEILVAKTLYLTGQLGDSDDGERLWQRWEQLRPNYHQAFNVPARIQVQNL